MRCIYLVAALSVVVVLRHAVNVLKVNRYVKQAIE